MQNPNIKKPNVKVPFPGATEENDDRSHCRQPRSGPTFDTNSP
jgi:hypothetical protein